MRIALEFTDQDASCGTAADDHNIFQFAGLILEALAVLVAQIADQTVGEADDHMQYKSDENAEEIEGSRLIDLQDIFRGNIAKHDHGICFYHRESFIDTDVGPDTVIQFKY